MHRGLGQHSRGFTNSERGLRALADPSTFGHRGMGSSDCWADAGMQSQCSGVSCAR